MFINFSFFILYRILFLHSLHSIMETILSSIPNERITCNGVRRTVIVCALKTINKTPSFSVKNIEELRRYARLLWVSIGNGYLERIDKRYLQSRWRWEITLILQRGVSFKLKHLSLWWWFELFAMSRGECLKAGWWRQGHWLYGSHQNCFHFRFYKLSPRIFISCFSVFLSDYGI